MFGFVGACGVVPSINKHLSLFGQWNSTGGGRAYKWCPLWGKVGITSTRITSNIRASDSYTKSRVAVHFGSQVRGHEGWVINNPKAKIVRRMLQLLQQRTGSGPLFASLKMTVWVPYSRMLRTGQSNAPVAKSKEPSALPTSKQTDTAPEKRVSAMPVWWKSSNPTKARHRDNEICSLLLWT